VTALAGRVGVALGLLSALLLAAQAARAWRRPEAAGPAQLRPAVYGLATGALTAMAALEVALLTDDFSVAYVAANHARATPLLFTAVSAWAALEGSIVLWGLVLAGYTAAVFAGFRDGDRLGAGALAVMGAVAVFFFGLLATAANPFQTLDPAPPDGPGPNALLQNHVLMAVHPPLLYLGYVGLTVPFAFAISALALGRGGTAWLARTRRWSRLAWTALTAGVVVGGWWSYEVLGWGGFWAWDPVENASLLPWLVATAFLHSGAVQLRRGILQAWNFMLVIAAFALTLLGTFLTRSGVVASVHSFTQSAVGPALLGFLLLVVVASLTLFALRADQVASSPRLDSLASREGALLVNNLLLTLLAFAVLTGTLYPIFVEAFTGAQVSVGRPFFDRMAGPIGLALLLGMGVGPLLPWRAARPAHVWVRLRWPAVVALAAGAALVLAGVRAASVVLVAILATGIVAAAAGRLLAIVGRQPLGRRSAAAWRALSANPGYWGGQLAHAGVALVAVAIAVTGALGTRQQVTLTPGQSAATGPFTLTFTQAFQRQEPHRLVRGARLELRRGGRLVAVLEPRLHQYPRQVQAVGTPAVRTGLTQDVYVSLTGLEPERVSLQVMRHPLMWLLWLGGLVTVAGGLWALAGSRLRRTRSGRDDTVRTELPQTPAEPTRA
jgi:cytochrome c-type biogenesis protein CcmF